MAALVDYTALTPATGFEDGYPVAVKTPVSGLKVDYWRKVRLDFSLTNLAAADWAKIMVIPANTYVLDVMTYILTEEGGASGITIGDASADGSTTWVATQDGNVADVAKITLVADANGATRGKLYSSAGALYLSATAELDTLKIDVYVHCINLNDA